MSLRLLSSIFCWPRAEKTKQEGSFVAFSQVQSREAGDRWAGAGPDGTVLSREGAHSTPSQPHPPLGPLEPVGSWGSLVAWLAGGWNCYCPQMLLLLPGKDVGSSVEVLEVALCHLTAWVGTRTGRGSASHVGGGLLDEAAGWIRSQGGSLASSQGT